jgi:hypothetical protein
MESTALVCTADGTLTPCLQRSNMQGCDTCGYDRTIADVEMLIKGKIIPLRDVFYNY